MSQRISERDLIVPALYCIDKSTEISTTELSQCLRNLLKPEGEDIAILSNRTDDKFSQKVRNLRSHETLEKLGLATYTSENQQGYWKLTSFGKTYLAENRALLDYLLEQGFNYIDKKAALAQVKEPQRNTSNPVVVFDETITEGAARIVEQKVYERSARLRDAAIRHYRKGDDISCAACGFNFREIYGQIGEGYIEIHHQKPIYSYEEDDIEKVLNDALKNVIPLCANCHRMVHRQRSKMLSLDELIEALEQGKKRL